MDKRNIEAIYPLSPMQQGMLFHSLEAAESGLYVEQLLAKLQGNLNYSAFEQAWQKVVDRHSILRTAFVWQKLEKMLQVVHRQLKLPITHLDWRHLNESEQDSQLQAFIADDRKQGLKLSEAPLLRLTIIQLADDLFQILWTHHHILLDGWSMPLVIKEVFTLYEAYQRGLTLNLPPARPYRDYIAWLQKQDLAKAEAYWRQTLKGFYSPTPLVVERGQSAASATPAIYLEQEIKVTRQSTATLEAFARKNGLTLNTLAQAAWALVLCFYSGESDIVFGATVSGRPAELEGVEHMVGLFINTLPVRVQIQPEDTALSWLKRLQMQQADLREYEYSQLVQIQGWSEVPRTQPLFESILVFENYPVDTTLQKQQTSLKLLSVHSHEKTNYPITVVASPEEEFLLKISYNSQRFEDATIYRMLRHLMTFLVSFAEQPQRRLRTIPILTEPEWQLLVQDWNNTALEFPDQICLHQWFEQQVEMNPDAPALAYENTQLSYFELNQKSNQVAHYLRKLGVGPEILVGICVERSPEMIIGLLGVLKAGGAYVPMDPSYPQERIEYMVKDSQVGILLTQKTLLQQIPTDNVQVIALDAASESLALESGENLVTGVRPDNLAYVIYTSGSTGRPKGVLLQHRGVCNFVNVLIRDMNIYPGSRVLQFASFSFDASVAEITGALLSGSMLYLSRRDVLVSVDDLSQLLRREKISMMTLPPSLLSILDNVGFPFLETVASVGESCTWEVAMRWLQGRRFMNGYGPTEASVGTAWQIIDHKMDGTTTVPIGCPINNVQVYILNSQLNPVPIGVPGEIYIGGAGLARGYLDRPDLTAEKFIPDFFSGRPGARLYKSGDLARYLPDGTIEFMGRVDFQVKIRGFRIELGEIEAALVKYPDVNSAVVIAREDQPGKKRLVAYLVPEKNASLSTSELFQFLKDRLPEYMVPSAFVTLNALPLTPNGKVDRRALPTPEPGLFDMAGPYVAPRTPVEEQLANIWQEILNLPRVGIHDNFLELGGHSLLATQLVSRIRNQYHIEFPLRHVFENPTIAALARKIELESRKSAGLMAPPILAESRTPETDLPLSFSQQRLWFLDQLAPGESFYNIPAAIRLQGELNEAALEKSLNEIVRRHESLRTRFIAIAGKPRPVIASELLLPVIRIDLSHLDEAERTARASELAEAEARQPFDLSTGPLLRAQLIKLAHDDHVALFTMHHIISDGWSMGVLIREIATLYAAFTTGQPSPLPDLELQYADFAHWQRQWLQGEVLEKQLDYWRNQLHDAPPVLELPLDRPRPAIQSFRGSHYTFQLPEELSQSVSALSRQEGATLFMTLLAAFQALLYRYSGQDDIVVGTPIANRTYEETESMIGFFVNTLVLRARFENHPDFKSLLAQTVETTMSAYAHQDLPFEKLVEELQPGRDLSHTPLFQVMFVLQNAPAETLKLPKLTFQPVAAESGTSKFDLTLIMAETEKGLTGTFEYNTDLFDLNNIARMAGHFQTLLQNIVAHPDHSVARLPILTSAEVQYLRDDWNQTIVPYPADQCFHELFEAQAEQTPEAVAAIFERQQLSYQDLNRKANQLARYLVKQGIGTGDLVGLCVERSLDLVIGIMGVLKAGAAYLPLDPSYPKDRLTYMIVDSGIQILLTQNQLLPQLAEFPVNRVVLDRDWESIAVESDENLISAARPDTLAYVIYTSGSTGKPKGVMLKHRGLVHLSEAQQYAFGVRTGNHVLQFAPFSFDASVWETIMALRSGGTLCLTRPEQLIPGPDMIQMLQDLAIDTITLPPSILAALPPAELSALRTIICAGEALPNELVQRWSDGRRFFNAYGPTEVTVCASYKLCNGSTRVIPPIGRPIANAQIYLLDRHLNLVPVGVPGELCVGGPGLAIGYLNRSDLVAEKFIPHPFSDVPGERLYRTGDLARYLPDGDIEFLGRIDHQVKVRGFRIELGEIEAVLGQHPLVRDVVVVAPDENRLVAYLEMDTKTQPTIGELRSFLSEKLPNYMIPSAFVLMESFPLSPSGKVDRKKLPAPEQAKLGSEREYVAPRSETETQLAQICAEILGLERVGIYDNFFELGGHSLLATQFIAQVRDQLQVELPLRAIFETPTVAGIAEAVTQLHGTPGASVEKIEAVDRGDDGVEKLLAELKGLEDDDVLSLLESKND